jgi:hypothetical protein
MPEQQPHHTRRGQCDHCGGGRPGLCCHTATITIRPAHATTAPVTRRQGWQCCVCNHDTGMGGRRRKHGKVLQTSSLRMQGPMHAERGSGRCSAQHTGSPVHNIDERLCMVNHNGVVLCFRQPGRVQPPAAAAAGSHAATIPHPCEVCSGES